MDLGQLKERVDYIEGELAELHNGEAEDKGARIENDRNRESIQGLKAEVRELETNLAALEEEMDSRFEILREDLEEVKEE